MSRAIYDSGDYNGGPREFENGDKVSFLHEGYRIYGEVVRVYSTRINYHVLSNGQRYEVHIGEDSMQPA